MFLIAPEYRNNEMFIMSMYNALVKEAQKRGKTQICYIDIVRDENHPLKPASFVSPEPWGETITGFESMGISVELSWPTEQADGSVKEEANILQFYIKNI